MDGYFFITKHKEKQMLIIYIVLGNALFMLLVEVIIIYIIK